MFSGDEDEHKKEFEELIKSEQGIKDNIKKNIMFNGNYDSFGILDYDWYIKYKTFLNVFLAGNTNEEFIYKYKEIDVKTEKKTHCFGRKNRSFNFICKFVLVSKNLLKLITKKLDYERDMSYHVIIGGQCMICRDPSGPEDNYITYYEENKGNNIDFWLSMEDEKERKKHLNIILNFNLWYYLGLINFDFKDIKKDIYNDKGKKIGHFFINCDSKRSEFFNQMTISYINQNLQNYQTFKANNKINIEHISKIYSILVCLANFKEFVNELYQYYQNNNFNIVKSLVNFFRIFQTRNRYNEIDSIYGLFSIDENIQFYLEEIFDLIGKEFEDNLKIEQNPKIADSDENLGNKKFHQMQQKGSVIQKLFFCINELKIKCSDCSLESYNFEYFKYLKINLEQEIKQISLNNKLFSSISFLDDKKKCSFCVKCTRSKIEEKIVGFSKIFIVVFEGRNYKYFNLKNNMMLSNNQNIIYNLKCFIEVFTNLVYIYDNNNWIKVCGNIQYEKVDNIENIKPVILFYQLYNPQGNNISNNNQNMMQFNQLNMNNNIAQNNNKMMNNNINIQNINNNFNLNINNVKNLNVMSNMNNNNIQMNNMMKNMNNVNFNMNYQNINNMNNMNMNNMNNMKINNMNNMKMNNMNNMNMNNMNNMNMNNMNNMNMNNMNMNMNMNNMNMNMKNMNINNMNINNMNINNMNMNMNNMNMNNMNNMNMNNMNMNMNNMNINNINMNLNNNVNKLNNLTNNNNNFNNNNNSNNQVKGNIIFVTFTFEKYNKQIFIDVCENEKFVNVQKELEDKYSWLRSLQNKKFFFKNKEITNLSATLKELKIENNCDIKIRA